MVLAKSTTYCEECKNGKPHGRSRPFHTVDPGCLAEEEPLWEGDEKRFSRALLALGMDLSLIGTAKMYPCWCGRLNDDIRGDISEDIKDASESE